MGEAKRRRSLGQMPDQQAFQPQRRVQGLPVLVRKYKHPAGPELEHRETPSAPWVPMRDTGQKFQSPDGVELVVWANDRYYASVRDYQSGFPIGGGPYKILSIGHMSERAVHDWRDFQRIKNDLCGRDWEGVELYPSEDRLVDPSNRFYLWCVPPGVIGWGLPAGRDVRPMSQSIAPQRPFPEEVEAAMIRSSLVAGVPRGIVPGRIIP